MTKMTKYKDLSISTRLSHHSIDSTHSVRDKYSTMILHMSLIREDEFTTPKDKKLAAKLIPGLQAFARGTQNLFAYMIAVRLSNRIIIQNK